MLSKMVFPFNTSITDLISRATESPPFLDLRNSINRLKIIDALDIWEDMTDLGIHLINMSIDLQYAKMIITSVVLMCLDPILDLVSILIIGEPSKTIMMLLFSQGLFHVFNLLSLKVRSEDFSSKFALFKKSVCPELMSDHLTLIKIYQVPN